MGRTLAQEKSFYPLLLCFILMLHIVAMILEVNFKENEEPVRRPLTVRIQNLDTKEQIAQSEDSEKKDVKDKAFLSDKNRSFDRQTRARVNDIFKEGAAGGGKKKQGAKDLKLSDLGTMAGQDPFKAAAKEYTEKKNGSKQNSPERKVSSTNDYLEDIPPGDLTNLNTVEYKYYGYYHRIRQKLEQFWGRSLYEKAEQMAQDGRRVPASSELITALQITMDAEGNIIGINILGSSGIKELDDAAVESFNEAGPFPNPPRDLIVDGKVTIEWGFVVQS